MQNWKRAKRENVYLLQYANRDEYVKNCENTYTVYSQSFNGAGTSYSHHKSPVKYKREAERNLVTATKILRSYKNLKVHSREATDLVEWYKDDPKAQIVLDPPYVGLYSACIENYPIKMVGLWQHMEMLLNIKDAKASIIICGYRPDTEGVPCIYDAILSENNWKCIKMKETHKKCEVTKIGGKKSRATEYVWTNHFPEEAKYYVETKDYKEKMTMEEYWLKIKECYRKKMISDSDMGEYEATYKRCYGEDKSLYENKEV